MAARSKTTNCERRCGCRRTIIEDAVEIPALTTLIEVIETHPMHAIGHVLRALLAVDGALAPEKEVAVDENYAGHGGKK